MLHEWYQATDVYGSFIRVLLVDYSKAFDLINHIFINKLSNTGISPFIVRWVASFLQDRSQRVKVGGEFSEIGFPNGGIPQGTMLGPKGFLVHINDLETPLPLCKYVDDCTIFEMCKLGM